VGGQAFRVEDIPAVDENRRREDGAEFFEVEFTEPSPLLLSPKSRLLGLRQGNRMSPHEMSRSFQRVVGLMLVVPAALFLPTMAQATTNLVLRVNLTLQVSFQSYDLLLDEKVTDNDLINLALGRTPPLAVKLFFVPKDSITRPATNEVLALAMNCGSNDVRLIVFDTNTSSNLATIAALSHVDSVSGKTIRPSGGVGQIKSEYITQVLLGGPFEPVGSISNNVTGGSLTLRLADNCKTNHPLTQASGSALGSLHLVVNGQDSPGMIKRGTLSTKGPPIATLVDE
jgi:hypothetical protein